MRPQTLTKGCKEKVSCDFMNLSIGLLAFVMSAVIGIFATLFLFFPEILGAIYADILTGFKENLK